MVKSSLVFFFFEILLVPSELLLPSANKAANFYLLLIEAKF
jgi:hypothetical protein